MKTMEENLLKWFGQLNRTYGNEIGNLRRGARKKRKGKTNTKLAHSKRKILIPLPAIVGKASR